MGKARIVTCTCAIQFYDTKGKTLCNRCDAHAKRIHTLNAEWQAIQKREKLTTRDGIFFCLRRKVRSVAEMALILGVDFREAAFAMDVIRQDAR